MRRIVPLEFFSGYRALEGLVGETRRIWGSAHGFRAAGRGIYSVAAIAVLTVSACGESARYKGATALAPQSIKGEVVDSSVLTLRDSVVVPTVEGTSVWFQRPRSIHRAMRPDHFWAVQGSELHLVDGSGRSVQAFGREGEGPEELRLATTIEDHGDSIFVLDNKAGRVVVFERSGQAMSAFRLESRVLDFAVDPSGPVYTVPGMSGEIDIYSDGALSGGIGSVEDDGGCPQCQVTILPDGNVLLAVPRTPLLRIFSPNDGLLRTIDLRVSEWEEWEEQRIRDLRASNRSRATSFKSWIGQIAFANNETALLLMYPQKLATELWEVDLSSGAIVRHYSADYLVQSAVLLDDGLYAMLAGSEGIVRFEPPPVHD